MSAYCPTCGLVGYRWAGCTDDYHYGVLDEQPFVCQNGDLNTNDPGNARTSPGPAKEVEVPPHE